MQRVRSRRAARDALLRGHARCAVFAGERRRRLDGYAPCRTSAGIRTRGLELVARTAARSSRSSSGAASPGRALAHPATTTTSRPASANGSRASPSGARMRSRPGGRASDFSATLGARYSGLQYNQLDNSDPHGTSLHRAPAGSSCPTRACATSSRSTGPRRSASTTSATSATGPSTPMRGALTTPKSPRGCRTKADTSNYAARRACRSRRNFFRRVRKLLRADGPTGAPASDVVTGRRPAPWYWRPWSATCKLRH